MVTSARPKKGRSDKSRPTALESYQRTDLSTVQYGFEVKLDKPESK